ncbi:hypothetical protein [Christiangramia aquimixticola]|uniref:hypothetical protein n=1 Tax=Christiangramia aquimixticola TaxID=1697558 RepID=UPI003AA8D910
MQQPILKFLKGLLPFSILLFAIQYFTVNEFLSLELYYSTISIYAFHVLATLVIYTALVFVNQNFKDNTGFAFLAGSLLKMLAAVIFLLPMMLGNPKDPFIDILTFFIPYFLFLIFETIYAVRLINIK